MASSRQAQGLGWLGACAGACCGWVDCAACAGTTRQHENNKNNGSNVPVARVLAGFKLRGRRLAEARLLVDVHFLAVLHGRRAAAVFLVDADLFFDVRLARRLLLLLVLDGGREGFVRLFVTFPSVCLLLR